MSEAEVQATEAAVLAAIEALEGEEKEFYQKEYAKPADEVYDGALQMMGENFGQLAAAIAGALGGQADLGQEGSGQGILQVMYASGTMGTSPIDDPKNAHFLALLNYHSEEVSKTKIYTEEVIVTFIKWLFEYRTVLAASIINLQREGNTINQ